MEFVSFAFPNHKNLKKKATIYFKLIKQTNTEIVKIKHIYFIIIIEDQSTVKPHSTDNTKKVQRRACWH